MRPIGPETRAENLERLATETFDVLIVGGGITGAGCLLDAASRGLKAALVERADFASGTSSKSSKLVHGGLRYLAHYDFGLTWEAAHERDLLARLAPQLVRPVRFLYPLFRKGREARFASLGLTLYDTMSAVRGVPRHRRTGAPQIEELAPPVDPARVVKAYTYWDAQTDDARLVFEILRAAHGFGAAFANYVSVSGFERDGRGAIAAAYGTEIRTGRQITIRARCVLNATGVWAGQVGALDDERETLALRPAKGIHLVVDAARLPVKAACIVPTAARDARSLFTIPWGERVVLGTTDTEHDGSLEDASVTQSDVDYVLAGINKWMSVELTPADVLAAWAGLRPLRAGAASARTADLSRRHAITVSRSGLVSVTGGKLTTYRRMARDAVDAVCERLGVKAKSRTHRLPIGLRKPMPAVERDVADLLPDATDAHRLVQAYGDLAPSVAAIRAEHPGLDRPVAAGLAITGAEIVWAARHEMTVTIEDALARRTRLALTDRTAGLGGGAPDLLAKELGWDAVALDAESKGYGARIAAERGPAAPGILVG